MGGWEQGEHFLRGLKEGNGGERGGCNADDSG